MNPLLPIEHLALLLPAILAVGGFLAWKTAGRAPQRLRMFITACRVLGLLALGIIALNPGHWKARYQGIRNEWAVLLDRSRSMATADVHGASRWAAAGHIAARIPAMAREGDDVRLYTFDTRLDPLGETDLSRLRPEGDGTDILQAGKSLLSQSMSTGKRLAGVILLSDGRQTREGTDDTGIRARAQESPIFALPLGGDVAVKDLYVRTGQRQYIAFAGQKLKLTVTVGSEGIGSISTSVKLFDPGGAVVGEQKVLLTNDTSTTLTFEISHAKPGHYQYAARAPVWEGEGNEANNEASIAALVLESKIRVFLAEGTPCWDSKFLVQLLRRQQNMEVTSVYRLSGDRYFKVDTDPSQASESSQPVFPASLDELARYDVVIFGKGVEYFLDSTRVKLLREAVRHRGVCVLFSRGKPYNGNLPDLESLEPVEWGEPVSGRFSLAPSREGEDAGLFGDMLPGRRDPVWTRLPPLSQARWCPQLKSFSSVLMHGRLQDGPETRAFPVVVTRRFGKGMVVAVNADGLWQWDFFPTQPDAQILYPEFWTQLLQWAITFSEFLPGQEYSLRLSDTSVTPETPVRIRIGRRSTGPAPDTIPASVWFGGKIVQELAVRRSGEEDNRWESIFSAREPGSYVVRLADANGNGAAPDICALLRIRAPLAENDNLSADPDFLRRLAETSGGRIVQESELAAVIRDTRPPDPQADMGQRIWITTWDRGWFLCLVLAFFAAEWFVRRRNGLM